MRRDCVGEMLYMGYPLYKVITMVNGYSMKHMVLAFLFLAAKEYKQGMEYHITTSLGILMMEMDAYTVLQILMPKCYMPNVVL